MSIALFNEPIEIELVKSGWDQTVTGQGMLLGIEQVEGADAWGYVVGTDGMITQQRLDECRTKWRYDAVEGWLDHGGEGLVEEPDVPSGGPD